jgi:hypothetical protein
MEEIESESETSENPGSYVEIPEKFVFEKLPKGKDLCGRDVLVDFEKHGTHKWYTLPQFLIC